MNKIFPAAVAAISLVTLAANADDGVRFPPVTDAPTLKECGACHVVFPPQMLPLRSWRKLMADLADHFGENAALEAGVREGIEKYLAENAADAPATKGGAEYIRGIAKEATPLRITETAYWLKEHDEIRPEKFKDPKIKSKANCKGCHSTADKGEYLEGDEKD